MEAKNLKIHYRMTPETIPRPVLGNGSGSLAIEVTDSGPHVTIMFPYMVGAM